MEQRLANHVALERINEVDDIASPNSVCMLERDFANPALVVIVESTDAD